MKEEQNPWLLVVDLELKYATVNLEPEKYSWIYLIYRVAEMLLLQVEDMLEAGIPWLDCHHQVLMLVQQSNILNTGPELLLLEYMDKEMVLL